MIREVNVCDSLEVVPISSLAGLRNSTDNIRRADLRTENQNRDLQIASQSVYYSNETFGVLARGVTWLALSMTRSAICMTKSVLMWTFVSEISVRAST